MPTGNSFDDFISSNYMVENDNNLVATILNHKFNIRIYFLVNILKYQYSNKQPNRQFNVQS